MFEASGMESTVIFFIGTVGLLVLATVGFVVVKGLSQWRADEASPLRSIDALVVARRAEVSRRAGDDRIGSRTSYFVTFEDESGSRFELPVTGNEYGLLAEGDRGHLIHQGTHYKGFTRQGIVDGPR